jgi:hypothetical protein
LESFKSNGRGEIFEKTVASLDEMRTGVGDDGDSNGEPNGEVSDEDEGDEVGVELKVGGDGANLIFGERSEERTEFR